MLLDFELSVSILLQSLFSWVYSRLMGVVGETSMTGYVMQGHLYDCWVCLATSMMKVIYQFGLLAIEGSMKSDSQF